MKNVLKEFLIEKTWWNLHYVYVLSKCEYNIFDWGYVMLAC